MTQAVKRACDACHRRKVKCDGINPCRNCSSAQLSCTYNAIPQKKGPKGSRAKVISELRETQRQTSLSAKVQNRMNGVPCPPGSPSAAPTPGLLTNEMVKDCIEFFFTNMYPTIPILDRRTLEQHTLYMEQNRDTYCLITSLCAFVMLQPGMSMPAGDPYNLDIIPGANIVSSTLLLEETLRVRRGYEYLDGPSLYTLATSYFIFACYHCVESHDRAWFYLREATTMMHMTNMTKEETYMNWDAVEASRRRRLYWLFFVTERAYAIQRQRPLTLQATINLPSLTDDPTDPLAQQLTGFVSLANVFRPFDDAFAAVWSKTRSKLSASYITALQKQLNDVLPSYHCQDSQLTDLAINQQWLKTTHWQLTSGGISTSSEDGVSFQYPIELSRELLVNLASQFPSQGIELLGSGLIEKLLEVACSTTNVLSMKPASRDPFSLGPREHLNQVLNVVAVLRNGDHRFLPLLLSKIGDVLPRLTNPMLQNAPENSNLASIDIFDGFGNAGMAQPPPQMHMSMDTEYDRKYSISEYEKKFSMSEMASNHGDSNSSVNSSNAAPSGSQADMTSPFVSSPAIMSPGIEFPHHNLNDFGCTPMPDMVISPIAGPGSGMTQPSQHQHPPMPTLQSQCLNPQQMQTGLGHSGNMALNASVPSSRQMNGGNTMMSGMPRQQPPRANSFAMPPAPIPRTVGDFHALQRANSDTNGISTLQSMGLATDMDFGGLR